MCHQTCNIPTVVISTQKLISQIYKTSTFHSSHNTQRRRGIQGHRSDVINVCPYFQIFHKYNLLFRFVERQFVERSLLSSFLHTSVSGVRRYISHCKWYHSFDRDSSISDRFIIVTQRRRSSGNPPQRSWPVRDSPLLFSWKQQWHSLTKQ